MSPEQREWLQKNPAYEPLGRVGGFIAYERRGTLRVTGVFIPLGPKTPIKTTDGAFGVGIRVVRTPGQVPDPRQSNDGHFPRLGGKS